MTLTCHGGIAAGALKLPAARYARADMTTRFYIQMGESGLRMAGIISAMEKKPSK